jgi:hypothetical protein
VEKEEKKKVTKPSVAGGHDPGGMWRLYSNKKGRAATKLCKLVVNCCRAQHNKPRNLQWWGGFCRLLYKSWLPWRSSICVFFSGDA